MKWEVGGGEWGEFLIQLLRLNWKYCLNNFLKELRKISNTSFRIGRDPADFLNEQLPRKGNTRYVGR
jgi:hypothetical protein